MSLTTLTMLLQKQNMSISRTVLLKTGPSELFGCFDPNKNKQHYHYGLSDDIGFFPRSNDQEELVVKCISMMIIEDL